ncbi:MAG: sigma factor-like helix-turn-helix DNA-binding protein [Nocardioides sp.]
MSRDRSNGRRHDHDEDFAGYLWARQPALLRTAYLLTGDRVAAEDLVQSTLADLYLSWGRVPTHEDLDAHVRRLLVRRYGSARRRARRHGADAVIDLSHNKSALWAGVQALPKRQRTVVVLRYFEGLDDREVAAALGTSVRAVRTLTGRAHDTLRVQADPIPA